MIVFHEFVDGMRRDCVNVLWFINPGHKKKALRHRVLTDVDCDHAREACVGDLVATLADGILELLLIAYALRRQTKSSGLAFDNDIGFCKFDTVACAMCGGAKPALELSVPRRIV